jgi:hypothetical protein
MKEEYIFSPFPGVWLILVIVFSPLLVFPVWIIISISKDVMTGVFVFNKQFFSVIIGVILMCIFIVFFFYTLVKGSYIACKIHVDKSQISLIRNRKIINQFKWEEVIRVFIFKKGYYSCAIVESNKPKTDKWEKRLMKKYSTQTIKFDHSGKKFDIVMEFFREFKKENN